MYDPRNDKTSHIHHLLTDRWYQTLFGLFSLTLEASHDFFKAEKIPPSLFPITTGSVSSPMGLGSDSLPVKVRIRENDVYLADSMQFSLEIGARLSGKGAYYVMPTFRGEPMDERHLNEFFHAEAEIIGNLDDVMGLIQRYVLFLARTAHDRMGKEISDVAGNLAHIDALLSKPEQHFKRVEYKKAVEELRPIEGALASCGTDFPTITSKGEAELIRRYGEFTWVTHMPWNNVPFYQARDGNTEYSMTADLLAGIGEVVGCGQRVLSPKDVDESLAVHEVHSNGYEWYRSMREVSEIQTSGFGMGLERFILWLTRKKDIRECMLLIRNHDFISYP